MKKLFIVLCLLSALSIFNITTNFVYAQVTPPDAPRGNTNITSGSGGPVSLTNPHHPHPTPTTNRPVPPPPPPQFQLPHPPPPFLYTPSGGNDEKVKQG